MNNDQPNMRILEEMLCFCDQHEYIYIYGYEHDQHMLKKYLNMIDYSVNGFLVSDDKGEQYSDMNGCIRCCDLRTSYSDYSNVGVIVATWDLYFN